MRSGRFRIALRERRAAAKENQVDPREIESSDVEQHGSLGRFGLLIARQRFAQIAFVVERMQLAIREFSRTQVIDHRLSDQARRADHGNAQGPS